MRPSLLSLLLLASAAPAGAIDSAAGTGGASFMKMGFGSPRATAMGRAYVAVAEGTEALTWNPAGLAQTQQRELSYAYMRYIQEVDAPLYMAYAHPMGRTVFGLNLAYISVDGFEARQDDGRPSDNTAIQVRNGFATFSLARSFWYEKLFLGIAMKVIEENNAGARRNSLVGDFGAILKPSSLFSLGFAVQNMGSDPRRVARITRVGAGLRPVDLLTVAVEVSKASDNSARLGLGAEFTLPEELLEVGQIQLRAGYYGTDDQGIILKQDRSFLFPLVGAQGIAFGIGLFTSQAFGYGIGLDYTMVPFGALGTSDQLSVKVKF